MFCFLFMIFFWIFNFDLDIFLLLFWGIYFLCVFMLVIFDLIFFWLLFCWFYLGWLSFSRFCFSRFMNFFFMRFFFRFLYILRFLQFFRLFLICDRILLHFLLFILKSFLRLRFWLWLGLLNFLRLMMCLLILCRKMCCSFFLRYGCMGGMRGRRLFILRIRMINLFGLLWRFYLSWFRFLLFFLLLGRLNRFHWTLRMLLRALPFLALVNSFQIKVRINFTSRVAFISQREPLFLAFIIFYIEKIDNTLPHKIMALERFIIPHNDPYLVQNIHFKLKRLTVKLKLTSFHLGALPCLLATFVLNFLPLYSISQNGSMLLGK